ncbi:MAG: NAD(P)H-binding protein [Candidatus Acidiferrales bacterium]
MAGLGLGLKPQPPERLLLLHFLVHRSMGTESSREIAITGAFSYTGKYLAPLLLDRGHKLRTLTNHPDANSPLISQIRVVPYRFDDPAALAESLAGCDTLINTYWVRFPHGRVTFDIAVENTRTLVSAAKSAGVRRFVHVSIANASLDSPLAYYRGKARLEEAVRNSGLSFAILRPTVIFGREDILINNIAWFVRHLPVFAVPGDGRYGVQPIFVRDMAALLADAAERSDDYAIDAVGPEACSFDDLIRMISGKIGRPARIIHVPAALAYVATKAMGWLLGDTVLTWEEYRGLMDNLLVSKNPATGMTKLSDWLAEHRDSVGVHYASEVARHF